MNKVIGSRQSSFALPLAIFGGQPFAFGAVVIVPAWIPDRFFWIYLGGSLLFFTALTMILKSESPAAHGLERAIPAGRLFLAFPMAIFGVEHLVYADFVATLVPSWIPGHLFWTYFTGIALIVAALSITIRIQARLAATLLGIMILLFVLLVSVPKVISTPGDRFVWSAGLRDLALSASALIFAATQARAWQPPRHWLITVGHFFIAIPLLIFGVQHFFYPDFMPGIPVNQRMPLWIPGHLFWSYFTGAAFIAAGVSLMIKKKSRVAASLLAVMLLLWLALIYIPILVADPYDTGYALVNAAMHLALCGGALILASTQARAATVHEKSSLQETALMQS